MTFVFKEKSFPYYMHATLFRAYPDKEMYHQIIINLDYYIPKLQKLLTFSE